MNRILIRRQYPVVRTQLDYGGAIGREWLHQNPPDYRSRGGRVERWTADALSRRIAADYDWWGIRGPSDALPLDRAALWSMEPVTPHSRARYHLTGPRDEIQAVLAIITSQWWQLPRGREFQAAYERAFPRRLDLEVEPTIVRTPTARRRRRQNPQPNNSP